MTKKGEIADTSCGCTNRELEEVKGGSKEEKARRIVRKQYKNIAEKGSVDFSEELEKQNIDSSNYSEEELSSIPQGSNLGLGSGNPVALANLNFGETVVDLGSGAGVDCFLAANKVGDTGKVIGIDMTSEMIDLARKKAFEGNYNNVEFRLGEIEHLPIADNTVDLIISNCVINLASNKKQVFNEAFRVLKPGGRMIISDIMFANKLPEKVSNAFKDSVGCVSSAVLIEEYLAIIQSAGFIDVGIIDKKIIAPKEKKAPDGTPIEGNQKITMIADGRKIELELTSEEIEIMNTVFVKAHVKGIKPNS